VRALFISHFSLLKSEKYKGLNLFCLHVFKLLFYYSNSYKNAMFMGLNWHLLHHSSVLLYRQKKLLSFT